jgi:hypothetical protein
MGHGLTMAMLNNQRGHQEMHAGPDYRPLTLSAIQAFCMLGLSALVA